MATAGFYVNKEYYEKYKAIPDKSAWIREKLDEQVPGYGVIPKPPELSDWRWQQHLQDHLNKGLENTA